MATREEQLAQLASIKSRALDIQATLNERQAAERNTPTVTPLTNNEGAIDAATLRSGGTPNMPEPTAPNVAESFQGGLQASTEAARTNLDTTLKTERDAALKRQDDLNKRQEKLVQNSNPENRETFQQEQRIVQNQMDAAETASASLEEDFNKRRSVVNELETVLTQGNQLIEQARGAPISRYRNAGVAEAMQNVQARAGVLNAVISGLDGNFNAAHSIINNTRTAVAAQWTDQLNYNKTYMDLVSSGQLAKNKINDDYASTQITLAERKLSQLEATAETINNLMIDPESAQFMADAGITLNDSVEEINAKMSEQTKVQERQDVMNELKMEGYQYVPFPGDREDVVSLEVGGKILSFVAPQDGEEMLSVAEAKSLGVPFGTTKGGAFGVTPGTAFNRGVSTSPGGGSVNNATPGMNDYDKNILTARIGKQIYGTRISDAEGKRVESFIKAGMAQGKSELQIMDDVLGFTVNRNVGLSENLRNTLLSVAGEDGLAGFDMLGLARLINNGSDAQAVQRVEQIVYDRAKVVEADSYIGEFSARYALSKGAEIRGLIQDMSASPSGFLGFNEAEAPIGTVQGTMQNWLGRFRGEDATAIRTSVTSMVAEMRNRLSGTAVTDSEAAFLEPLIPDLSDSPANFMKKLEQLESDPLLRLNTIRSTFNLPSLNEESLLNSTKRVGLYSTGDSHGLFTNQPVKDTANPGGI